MEKQKLVIKLKPWEYTCSDGCCTEYGLDVFVNDVKVTEYGDQDHILVSSILNHLGYDVEIIGFDEDYNESWGFTSEGEFKVL
ncbi:MAG: hypothetical protein AB7V16_07350 [Vulcanibacillus sp.]